jgi:hypothetical protein
VLDAVEKPWVHTFAGEVVMVEGKLLQDGGYGERPGNATKLVLIKAERAQDARHIY